MGAAYNNEMRDYMKMLAGDLRRLEQDSVDGKEATAWIAKCAGVDNETVIKVLSAFFLEAPPRPPHDEILRPEPPSKPIC